MSEKLIEPMISAYTVKDNDAELFNEQGLVILGLLVEKFPEKAIPSVLETIKKQIKHKSKAPYLFLFEPINHGYTKNYTNELIEILKNPNLYWPDSFIKLLVDLEIKEAIPILKVMLTKLKKPKNFLEPERTSPELLYLQSKWSSLMSYGMTVDLLEDWYPEFRAEDKINKILLSLWFLIDSKI